MFLCHSLVVVFFKLSLKVVIKILLDDVCILFLF